MRVFWLACAAALAGCVACSDEARGGGAHAKGGAAGDEAGDATSPGGTTSEGGATSAGGVRSASGANAGGPGGAGSGAGGRTAPSGSAGATGTGGSATAPGTAFGKAYAGGEFHLGPVDYDETEWHNACAPGTKYAPSVRAAEGNLLAGLWNAIPDVASYCDACISVTTAKGKSAVLRVVTYGETTTNSIDVSPQAFDILNSGEYPRAMTFQFVECPATGKMMYEFQTGSNEWWTSLWLRNARVPLSKVEVKSKNHAGYVALERGSDGTLTDGGGFGNGSFSIRSTGVDGRQVVDDFTWPSAGIAGAMLTGKGNFD